MSPRRVTLIEVARHAGVSPATASKALNGKSRVAALTRTRVETAASALGYAPNALARSLVTGRTSTVAMLIRDSRVERFVLPVLLGAEAALNEIDLSLIVCDAHGDDDRAEVLLTMLRRRTVDGVLVVGDNNAVRGSLSDRIDVPVVYVYGQSADPRDVSHVPHDHDGAALATEHLIGAGRRRLAHLTGPPSSRAVTQRAAGVHAALRGHGLQLTGPVTHGRWSQRWSREATSALLGSHRDVDALVCGSDQLATGAVEALIAAGRRVPDDVAVTGFDNWAEFVGETDPPLTSVDMNLEALGAAAAGELFDLIDGVPATGGVRRHSCSLVVRGSAPDRDGRVTAT